ncbi:hypothetical protein LSH36_554g00027 [Paralvinella palmiformis]|uniref:Uncharacterized protein n=1 Tax=Paralvinella palmiformis TaxID=53620 RepID=A0AAD9MXH8_9ANNE|nr:hypothetical protein LSH36_554g00027 [Paralvinella palmiformis]
MACFVAQLCSWHTATHFLHSSQHDLTHRAYGTCRTLPKKAYLL